MDHISRQSVWIFRTSIDILFGCAYIMLTILLRIMWIILWIINLLYLASSIYQYVNAKADTFLYWGREVQNSQINDVSIISNEKIKRGLINVLTWQSLLLCKTIIILRQYPIKSNYHPMIFLSIIEQIMSIYSTELNEEFITCIAACSDPVCRKND